LKVSRAHADLAVSGAQVTAWQSLRFAIQICTAPGLNPRFARLAYLEGGDDIKDFGKPVNRDFRCSTK
jgi:hypothetical protein